MLDWKHWNSKDPKLVELYIWVWMLLADRMGVANRICHEGGLLSVPYLLHKAESRDRQGCLLSTARERVPGIVWRSVQILEVLYQINLVANRCWPVWKGQSDLYITPWIVQISAIAFPREECAERISTNDGHRSVNNKLQFAGLYWANIAIFSSSVKEHLDYYRPCLAYSQEPACP